MTIAGAGAARITFQIEALLQDFDGQPSEEFYNRARALALTIRSVGCFAGVCLAPDTPVSVIEPLVAAADIDLVDVLTVLPGIGGQSFRPDMLEKVRALRKGHPDLPYIMVDGGIDAATALQAAEAGANVLVSGSYLFGAPHEMASRIRRLEDVLCQQGD